MMIIDGWFPGKGGLIRGYTVVENEEVSFEEGEYPREPDMTGVVIPTMTDWHTHCADAGVNPDPGMTLEDVVAPPNGLKHVYLRNAPEEELLRNMTGFCREAEENGIGRIFDFREGGAEGCRLLRKACEDAIILGRPVSSAFDGTEMDDLLSVADGIGLPSISDMGRRYIEKTADAAHAAGKPFAIHVSERIREDIEFVLSLEPSFIVHMVEATDSDLRRCADADIPIVVCPRSNRIFGKVPPLRRMSEAGCTLTLGTDNAMFCEPDMRPEAALAADILTLQGGAPELVWDMLLGDPKILNQHTAMEKHQTKAGFILLPSDSGSPRGSLASDSRIIPLKR